MDVTPALVVSVAALLAGCTVVPRPAAPVEVKILAFNDFHGNLQSPGNFSVNTAVPAAARPPVGGAEFLAAHVARLKAKNPRNVVVGAGDFVGASPLVSALFFDEPAVEALNRIGVEFTSVGNHEFDKGAAELRRLQHGGCKLAAGAPDPNSCKGLGSSARGRFDGARFRWLSANVIESATGRPLLAPYAVKAFDGVKIGFVGVTLQATPAVVTPSGVAGLRFIDEAEAVNALVPGLRAQGAAAIVLLVHQGGTQAAAGIADINGCDADLKAPDGSDSDIGRIVARLDDAVDLVISGHTHQAYNCSASTVDVRAAGSTTTSTPRPTGLPNRAGRRVPVTSASAYGRVLTEIDLSVAPGQGGASRITVRNHLVDRADPDIVARVAADPTVGTIVAGYAALAAPLAARELGRIAAPLANAPGASGEMAAGNLLADAHLLATQPSTVGGAVMAFTNPGGVRGQGFATAGASYPQPVSYGAAFTVQPFGNSLVTMTLTAGQLKALLEQQFAGCGGQTAQRVLQLSNGLRARYDPAAPACARVVDLGFTPTDLTRHPPAVAGAAEPIVADGVVLRPERTYRVTVNSFLADGGDGFAVLRSGTERVGGPQDIDALAAYLGRYKAPQPPYDPADPALQVPRITRRP